MTFKHELNDDAGTTLSRDVIQNMRPMAEVFPDFAKAETTGNKLPMRILNKKREAVTLTVPAATAAWFRARSKNWRARMVAVLAKETQRETKKRE